MGFLDNIISGITSLFSGIGFNQPSRLDPSSVPQAFTIISDPLQALALPKFFQAQRERISLIQDVEFLQSENTQAQEFISKTFRTPSTPRSRGECGGTGQFSCGKFNFTTFAKGSQFSLDPFTGSRILTGLTQRANLSKFNLGQIQANFQRVSFGNNLLSTIQAFISENRTKIGLFSARIDSIQTL